MQVRYPGYRQARAYTHSHVQTLTYRLNSLNIYGKSSQGYPFTAPFEPKLHSMVAHCLALWGVEPMICSLVRTQLAYFTSGFDSPLSPVRPIMIICRTQSAVRECEDLQADLETTLLFLIGIPFEEADTHKIMSRVGPHGLYCIGRFSSIER